LTLTNSTVSNNTAFGFGGYCGGDRCPYGCSTGYGGGISGDANLINTTVSGNSANADFGGIAGGSVSNSIVADNSPDNCSDWITDNGNNFADDGTCGAGFAHIVPGQDFDTRLSSNHRTTPTHALLPYSVAIDAAGNCGLATDQRGLARSDGMCDSGAFEYGATPPWVQHLPPELPPF